MKYTINAYDPKRNRIVLYEYDNLTNKVVNEHGFASYFWTEERFAHLIERKWLRKLPLNKVETIWEPPVKTIRKLKVQLGLNCNLRCAYCLQRDKADNSFPSRKDEDRFFENWEKSGLVLEEGGRIELWGGEPIVYMKRLETLLPRLRERFGHDKEISIITNGTLLTDRIVDFLLDNEVHVIISHDGPGYPLRGETDPLDEPQIRATWMRLFEKTKGTRLMPAFHAVITPLNADIYETRKYLEEKTFPGVGVSFEGVVYDYSHSNKKLEFTDEALSRFSSTVFTALTTEPQRWPDLNRKAQGFLKRMVNRNRPDTIKTHCENFCGRTVVTDLHGNLLACQNAPAKTAAIGAFGKPVTFKGIRINHWSERKDCRDCHLLSLCKGGCPILDACDHVNACMSQTIFYNAIFTVVWFWLTGTIIESIEPQTEA